MTTVPRNDVDPSQLFEFKVTAGTEISDQQLTQCARLFTEHYGVWAPNAPAPLRPGTRVKLSAAKLKTQCMGNPERTALVTCFLGGQLIGHAFATTWDCGADVVAWVTQLVVHADQRRKNVATTLLKNLTSHEFFIPVTIFGVASSHPAACNAVSKLVPVSTAKIDTDFIAQHAAAVIESTPVEYLKNVPRYGSLFGGSEDAVVSLVFTNYYVDHTEPREALAQYIAEDKWPLGQLKDGHEFLVLIPSFSRA